MLSAPLTLKMAAPCGGGGAGPEAEVVLTDGDRLRVDGRLTAALTDLEYQ